MIINKIKGLVRLFRFELPFSAGICVVMGQLLAAGKFASFPVTISGFLSVFSISSSILALNDYFDVESDKINAPDRPIPSKIVTSFEALLLSIFLLCTGLFFSYLISGIAFLCSIILLVVGFLYNWKLKKYGLPGNIMVSISVGMTFIYGGVSVGLPFNNITLFFGLITALIDLGEEIASDSMDMRGDAIINSNSLAIKYGKQTALRISSYIFFFIILLTSFPFILNWFPIVYLIPFIFMDIVIAYSSLKLLNSDNNEGRKYIRWIYLSGLLCMLIFLLIRLII